MAVIILDVQQLNVIIISGECDRQKGVNESNRVQS